MRFRPGLIVGHGLNMKKHKAKFFSHSALPNRGFQEVIKMDTDGASCQLYGCLSQVHYLWTNYQ